MSVDDRLRRGLEENATSFVPAGESRLVEVHRRKRRRTATMAAGVALSAAAVVVTGVLAVGRPDAAPRPDPAEPSPTATETTESPAPTYDGPVIPDSTWRRVITADQARNAGVDDDLIEQELGRPDGRLPMELRFLDDSYSQTGDYGGPARQVGDQGAVRYDARGRLVISSGSCDDCDAVLTWRIAGNRLVFSRYTEDGPVEAMERLVWLGTWQRVGS